MSVFGLSAVILNFRTTGLLQRLLNALTLPLSGLLTARFVLHLRRWERNSDAVVSGSMSTPGNERNQELSEFEAVRRTMTSLVDEFGEDPVVRERHRDTLPVEHDPVVSQSRDKDDDPGEKFMSVKEGKRRAMVQVGCSISIQSNKRDWIALLWAEDIEGLGRCVYSWLR